MLAQISHASKRGALRDQSSTHAVVGSTHDTEAPIRQYMKRRSFAFDLAEDAYWNNQIGADAYMLFRLLARLCKEKTYCWPGLDYLAKRMHTSVGTIKRRLNELEASQLIARQQRAGGYTSYTYVCPLQHYDKQDEASSCQISSTHTPSGSSIHCAENETSQASCIENTSTQVASPLFFVPEQRINHKQSDRSPMISQTVKSLNTNLGGGKVTSTAQPEGNKSHVVGLLQQVGVLSQSVLDELKNTPAHDVEVCIEFARRQQHIVDPAAFAVSIIRLGLAAKLTSSRAFNGTSRTVRSNKTRSTSPYNAAPFSRNDQAASKIPETPIAKAQWAGSGDARQAANSSEVEANPQRVWSRVLHQLEQQLPEDEMTTWLCDTRLVDIGDAHALIAAPNIFARDMIAAQYLSLITAALTDELGQPVNVRLVIG